MKVLYLSYGYMESGRLEPYRERIALLLAAAGCEILTIKTNSFFYDYSHLPRSTGAGKMVADAVRSFTPDAVVSINRTGLTPEIVDLLPPYTKKITWFQDPHYYATPELNRFDDRDILYFIFPNLNVYQNLLRDFALKHGAKESQIFNVPFCLDDFTFQPQGEDRDINISFVASSFGLDFTLLLMAVRKDKAARNVLLDVYFGYRDRSITDPAKALRDAGFSINAVQSLDAAYAIFTNGIADGIVNVNDVFSNQVNMERRLHHVAALADLGLVMYGQRDDMWVTQMAIANPKLLRCYRYQTIDTPDELAALYARSKIGFNISRIDAANVGFSFRVPEVMASGAALVVEAEATPSLTAMGFKEEQHYVAFTSPADLRKKCETLLTTEGACEVISKRAMAYLASIRDTTALNLVIASSFDAAGFRDVAEKLRVLTPPDVDPSLLDKIAFLGDFKGHFDRERVTDISRMTNQSSAVQQNQRRSRMHQIYSAVRSLVTVMK